MVRIIQEYNPSTPKLKIMKCPECNKFLEENDFGYLKCPNCEGEWWPAERDDTPEKLAKAARSAYYEDLRVGNYGDGGKKSGGSKGKNYNKKKITPICSQRYLL